MPAETLPSRGERAPISANPEVRSPERRVLFVPGITASNPRNKGYVNALNTHYGEGNVLVMNSMASDDKINPGRWQQMKDFITSSDEQAGIDIVGYSLGSAELYKVIRSIEKDDPDFFKNQTNKGRFHFVMMDPSGFNKGLQKIDYAMTPLRLAREHGNFPVFSRKRALVRGIDSLIAFPPEGFAPEDMQALVTSVRSVFPGLAKPEEREGLPIIDFQQKRDNADYKDKYVSREDKERAAVLDRWLLTAVRDGELRELRSVIRLRGEVFKDAIDRIYESRLEAPLGFVESDPVKLRFKKSEGLRMFLTAMGRRPMDKYRELSDMGYDVDLISLENGIAVPLKRLVQMFGKDNEKTTDYVHVAEFLTHPGPSLQTERTAQMIWNLGQQRAGGILTA